MQSSHLLLVAVAALVVPSRPADACTCAPVPPEIAPRDGAVGVPTDAVVFVATRLNVPTVELRTAAGARVPLTLDVHARKTDAGAWVKATPPVLAPNTRYELVVAWAYGVEHTTFTTAATAVLEPLVFAGMQGLTPEVMPYPVIRENGSPCFDPCVDSDDHVSRLRLDFERPPTAALVVLEVTREADGALVDEIALPRDHDELPGDDYVLGFTTCDLRAPRLEPDTDYCGTITAYDARGRAVGGETRICSSTATCAPALSELACVPADSCEPVVAPPTDDPVDMPVEEPAPVIAETGGCASTTAVGGLVAILVPALLPRRRTRRA